jgi:hypothetical protein
MDRPAAGDGQIRKLSRSSFGSPASTLDGRFGSESPRPPNIYRGHFPQRDQGIFDHSHDTCGRKVSDINPSLGWADLGRANEPTAVAAYLKGSKDESQSVNF